MKTLYQIVLEKVNNIKEILMHNVYLCSLFQTKVN